MALNNNQCATVINSAVAQALGAPIQQLTLQDIIDTGNDSTIIGTRDNFTKALISQITTRYFTDSSYRSEYKDEFFVDSSEWGAIISAISIDMPVAEESHAWQDFTTPDKTVGTYKVYIPVVNEQLFGKSNSWEINITITDEQWDTAFKSAEELANFVNYIFIVVDNSVMVHREEMNMMNRNNFIAEKIAYSKAHVGEGIHVVNLVEMYAKLTGKTALTVNEFLTDEKALRFAVGKIKLFSKYMQKINTQFNTAGRSRFTPSDRMVVQILTDFMTAIETVSLSTAFNANFVNISDYSTVPYWQSTNKFDFGSVSSINVKIASDGTAVEQTGIVAFMCDKWAIRHTIKKHRVAVHRADPEELTTYFNQSRDMYINDLTMNAIVFVVTDYTAAA